MRQANIRDERGDMSLGNARSRNALMQHVFPMHGYEGMKFRFHLLRLFGFCKTHEATKRFPIDVFLLRCGEISASGRDECFDDIV